MIGNCILLGVLALFAWIDLKQKEFSLLLLGASAALGFLLFFVTDNGSLFGVLGGMCVGGVLMLCTLASRESIGLGDGLLLVVTGIYLGLWENLVLLFLAAAFCAATGLILVLMKKCTRKQTLPFAPFLLVSDVAMMALMM